MSTIVTRAGKGSPLTWTEVDNNFTNLNNDKIQSGNTVASLTITSATINGGAINATTVGASTPAAGTFTSLSDSGNLTFTGTGNRITGDFSNATVANRVNFQTSSSNSGTYVSTLPSGTGNISGFFAYNAADGDNASLLGAYLTNTVAIINSSKNGTGTNLPLTFYTGGSERMRIDTSGNVGIGTSSPWYKLDVNGNIGIRNAGLYFDGTSSSPFIQKSTSVRFDVLNVGGLDANSPFWIGYHFNTPDPIVVSGNTGYPRAAAYWNYNSATNPTNLTFNLTTGNNATGGTSGFKLGNDSAAPIYFITSNTERMRIDSSGYVSIGTTANMAGTLVNALNGYTASNSGATTPYFQTYNANAGTNLKYWRIAGNPDGSFGFETVNDAYTSASTRMRIDSSGNVLVTTPAGLGYGTGAGGTVTQATNKSTAVTLNKPTGQITMNNAALAAGARITFGVNNSLVGSQDLIIANALNNANYRVECQYVVSGLFSIAVTNMSGGSLSEALAIQFAIIKGATA